MLAAPVSVRRPQDELGAYLAEVAAIPLLSADEERELGERTARGDADAVERLVRANLRLVVYLARGFAGSGVPLTDLVQEGNQGLMRAARKYDVTRGVRFATYAAWWIRQAIGRGIPRNKAGVRLPDYMVRRVAQLRREKAAPASPPNEQVLRAERVAQRPASLEQLMRTKALARSLEKQLAGLIPHDPVDTAERSALRDAVQWCLDELPERFRAVLQMRFGLGGRRARTLADVGRKLGVSRERVRQIEMRALEMLRSSTAGRSLSSFAES